MSTKSTIKNLSLESARPGPNAHDEAYFEASENVRLWLEDGHVHVQANGKHFSYPAGAARVIEWT